LQDETVRDYVDQDVFNPTMYREELKVSFGRQRNFEIDVTRNDPTRIPVPHKLEFYGAYYQLGGCADHYAWRATAPDGSALRNVHAVAGNLVYFGHGSYGNNNPFIDFRVFGNLVLIDPMAADMGVAEELESPPLPPSVPTAAPAIYTPLGRLYDPAGTHLGKPCAADASAPRGELKPLPPSPAFLYCDVR
jgi:hypothetical protein